MVRKRLIPCLLYYQGGLYKTIQFKKHHYIGDPINAIRIFNDKEVDELMFLDIEATALNKEPNYKVIEDIASECFMPLCYGGGIRNTDQMKRIYELGVEKISISSAFFSNPSLVESAAKLFGSSSVVVTLDVKKDFFGGYKIYTHNSSQRVKQDLMESVKMAEKQGAGELVINNIDRDGMMKGMDNDLIMQIKSQINIPIIAMGGIGNIDDVINTYSKTGIKAIAIGSMAVYHGHLKGVLINYPPSEILNKI